MSVLNEISENLQNGRSKAVKNLVVQALEEGVDPAAILNEGLLAGMSVIGEQFKVGEVFVPEVLVAARAMNMGLSVLKPHLTDRPVFAGMIGPFSLAARLFDVSEIMIDCYDDPDMVHTVLEKATAFLTEYAKAYKDAGADGIVMAEPVAGLLSPKLEAQFSAPYVKEIVDAVQDDGFVLIYHNCGDNVPLMTKSLMSIGAAAYHFGNAVDLKTMLESFPSDVPVMGNVDPAGVLKMGSVDTVRAETLRVLEDCSAYENFVLSSGCDIPPRTPWENLDAFLAAGEFYGS